MSSAFTKLFNHTHTYEFVEHTVRKCSYFSANHVYGVIQLVLKKCSRTLAPALVR